MSNNYFETKSFKRRKRRVQDITLTITAVIIIICILFNAMYLANEKTYTTTVVKTERVYSKDSRYLIFTEDKSGNIRVFENTDEFFKLKFNSSDLYAEIKEGETYTFTVIGYRIPFLSMYENIIDVEWSE